MQQAGRICSGSKRTSTWSARRRAWIGLRNLSVKSNQSVEIKEESDLPAHAQVRGILLSVDSFKNIKFCILFERFLSSLDVFNERCLSKE